jgi:hypothetical protein
MVSQQTLNNTTLKNKTLVKDLSRNRQISFNNTQFLFYKTSEFFIKE